MKNITWEQITSRSRKARIVAKRNAIAVTLRNRLQGARLEDIGYFLGGRTPATIHRAINQFYKWPAHNQPTTPARSD